MNRKTRLFIWGLIKLFASFTMAFLVVASKNGVKNLSAWNWVNIVVFCLIALGALNDIQQSVAKE